MSNIAIRVENLSKRYRIGLKDEQHDTLAGAISSFAKSPFKNLRRLRRLSKFDSPSSVPGPTSVEDDIIWALNDVSFEVKRGEIVGIIGRNGAGKSTLLKILSRITHPTSGRVEIHGRVSSLLEVGTGFHPELTGRDNIYLNGTILGMRKAEIDKKFDEIVDFSGVEKFIDTPVKRYSSGMRVRLAFSVAAHLEPDILLVDEVLAVGDSEFQKKCLGKMEEVAKEGRTVLFVSHNMSAIETLCSRALLFKKGRITLTGKSSKVISFYLMGDYVQSENLFLDCLRRGNGKLRITSFRLESPSGEIIKLAKSGSPTVLAFDFENYACDNNDRISISFSVHTYREIGLFHYYSHFSNVYFNNIPGKGTFKCLLPELPLSPNNYLVGCRVVMNGDHRTGVEVDWPQVYVPITVVGTDFYGVGSSILSTWGPVLVKGEWSMYENESDNVS